MLIIYTCPYCGCDLQPYEICTNPPIPAKYCPNCGKRWESKPKTEQILRIPYNPEEDE